MKAAILIAIMGLVLIFAEDAIACMDPNVVDLNTPNLSPSYVRYLVEDKGYFSSPYDTCDCIYNPNVAWEE
jgi:hypothetical protein